MSSPSVVHLWFCPLGNIDDVRSSVDALKQCLSDDELEKVARYRQPEMREQALYVRGCLRVILSQFATVLPHEWRFEYGEKGKPRLCEKQRKFTGLEFNLSHSGDHLLVGIIKSGKEPIALGVDIEHARASLDIYPILNNYFSPQEADTLLALPSEWQSPRFFDLWVLKESVIKATGLGLAQSLKSFEFDLSTVRADRQEKLPLVDSGAVAGPDCCGELELYRDIGLRLIDDSVHTEALSTQWQICLGRVDEQYRFAVALSDSAKPLQPMKVLQMQIEACWLSPSQLLALHSIG